MNPYKNKRTLPVGKLEYKIDNSIENVPAQLEFGEKELVYSLPSFVGGERICNLGDAQGGSAILMALGSKPDGRVWTVDCYSLNDSKNARDNYDKFGVGFNITQIVSTTDKSVDIFQDEYFDVLFIDADHSYKNVLKDLQNYVPKVRPGGIFALHDTNQDDVDKAMTDFGIDKFEMIEWVNRIKVFKKGEN